MNRNMEVPGGRRRREKFHRVPSFRTGKASKAVNLNSGFDCAVSVYQAGVCHGALVHDLSEFLLLLPGLFGPDFRNSCEGVAEGTANTPGLNGG